MISFAWALIVAAVAWWLLRKRTGASLAAFIVLFSLLTRVIALLYVDVAGPMRSDQLEFEIGGDASMPLFAGSVLAFLLPLAWVFRPAAMRNALAAKGRPLYDAGALTSFVFYALCVFAIAVYAQMLAGPIPLLQGIDRLEYDNDIAGRLHNFLKDNNFLIAFLLGLTMVQPRLAGGDLRPGAIGLLVAFMIYFALTGNRFSAFFAFASFFVIPLSALLFRRHYGTLAPPPRRRHALVRFVVSPLARSLLTVVAGLAVLALLINSVVNVRGYDDPANLFFQRIFVQPIELWWATWADMQAYGDNSFDSAWYELFVNPIDASRNTSVRMLMINSLGYERALELADQGNQFAGGYPEVLFELLGPWRALPAALVFGVITALLLRLVVVSVCHGRIATATVGLYVFFGFTLLYIGGMLNFLIVWTYWVKCAALLVVWLIERRHVGARVPAQRAAAPARAPRGA